MEERIAAMRNIEAGGLAESIAAPPATTPNAARNNNIRIKVATPMPVNALCVTAGMW